MRVTRGASMVRRQKRARVKFGRSLSTGQRSQILRVWQPATGKIINVNSDRVLIHENQVYDAISEAVQAQVRVPSERRALEMKLNQIVHYFLLENARSFGNCDKSQQIELVRDWASQLVSKSFIGQKKSTRKSVVY